MIDAILEPWPWYVAGPLIGLFVPLFLIGGRLFGVSSSFRHICAAALPGRSEYFRYDWRRRGLWNLCFVAGAVVGGAIAGSLLSHPDWIVGVAEATRADLAALGVRDVRGLVPDDLFSWPSLASLRGVALILGGGFLVGFGARYAGGCTSGHGITGLATGQLASLFAVAAFFAGGLVATHLLLPLLLP